MAKPRSACRGLTILIVEDDDDFRDFLVRGLKALGAYVVEANSVARALGFLDTMTPDLLVSDLALRDVDGFQLIERMRASPGLRDIPAIAVSGHPDLQAQAMRSGFHRFVGKPVEVDELCRVIAELVTGRASRGKPRAPSSTLLLIVDDIPHNREMY